jgi:hypothetical protein
VAASSLALALGIGMVSGSIQHFQDIPERAALLIPLGLILSAAAFLVRNRLRPRKDDLLVIASYVVIVAAFLAFTLSDLASRVADSSEGGHSHGAAAEAATPAAAKPTPDAVAKESRGDTGHSDEAAKADTGVKADEGAKSDEPAKASDGHDHEH